MSVYIPGMELPKSCFTCPFRRKVDPDNIMCIVTREVFEETFAGTIETRSRGNCPLIPVPDHGRLIDADALPTYDKPIGKMMMFGGEYVYTQTAIDNAPTIIQADKEEEG